jgi:hypothetical protein
MKTKFTEHSNDACSIKYKDKLTDLIENRTFARDGHYVLEIGFNGYERQLCKGLSIVGITVMIDESVDLIDVIRKEYKIFKRNQSKFLRHYL